MRQYAYEVWVTYGNEKVATLDSEFNNWEAAQKRGHSILDASSVVITHDDGYNPITYWLRGGKRLQRDGFGYVSTVK